MKITGERFEISSSELIPWEKVKRLRLLNDKLAFVLTNGQVIELSNLNPNTIDIAFRFYEKYLRDHPSHRKKRTNP